MHWCLNVHGTAAAGQSSSNGRTTKHFLYSFLKDQPIWQSPRFWNAAFFYAVQQERASKPLATRSASPLSLSRYVFSSTHLFIRSSIHSCYAMLCYAIWLFVKRLSRKAVQRRSQLDRLVKIKVFKLRRDADDIPCIICSHRHYHHHHRRRRRRCHHHHHHHHHHHYHHHHHHRHHLIDSFHCHLFFLTGWSAHTCICAVLFTARLIDSHWCLKKVPCYVVELIGRTCILEPVERSFESLHSLNDFP